MKNLGNILAVLYELIFIKKDTLAHLQSIIAPVAVPMAPAVLLGSKVYGELMKDDVMPHYIALAVSIGSSVGVEAVGGLSSYTAVLKATRRDWWGLFLAVIGVATYIVTLVVSMIYFEAPAFGFFALLTPAAFMVAALFAADGVKRTEQLQDTDKDIARMNAQKNLTNAEARKLRQMTEAGVGLDMSVIGRNVAESSTNVAESSTDAAQSISRVDMAINDYLGGLTNKSALGRKYQVNRGTINRWLKERGVE